MIHRPVHSTIRCVVPLLLALACAVSNGHAATQALDDSFAGFGNHGSISVSQNMMCHAVAPDGKIVLAGTSGSSIVVSRRLPNGDPDLSFGGDGTVSVTHPDGPTEARSVAVQADGKIVVAGLGVFDGFYGFLVVRLTTTGGLDAGFSGNGFASAWISTFLNQAQKVLIQPDGKIVVVGFCSLQGDRDFAVARFNSDGTPDASFSGDGKTSVGFGGNDECFDAVLQADGKLVLVGGTEGIVLLDEDFAMARLHIDGSLDGSFDGDGKVQTGFGDFYDRAYAVAIQPSDLRIVVMGQGGYGDVGRAARYYSSDGSLDDSFDGDGKMSLPIAVHDAAINTAGKIALIGIDPNQVARALRLNANGSLDPEWQLDGDVIVDSDIYERPSLSLLADSRVLTVVPKGGDCRLLQWWADGDLDGGGRQLVAWDNVTFRPGSQEVAEDLAIQADGKIVLAGSVSTAGNTETDFAVARLLTDGRLDPSFGVRGRATLSLGNYDYAKAVVIQPDGKIVVAGYTGIGNATNFMIARFTTSGALDNTFGFGGFNALDFMGGPDFGWALALQPDGKILVAGTVFNGARNVYGVARFNSNGTVDNSFDLDGKQLYEFSVGPSHFASAVVVQGSGRIVIGGTVGGNFALLALTTSGSVDASFGTLGTGTTTRDLGGSDYLEAMAMGTDGRIYAAGARVISGNGDWVLSRWPASAGLVPCIPVCPWSSAFVDFGATSGWVDAIDVRSDGHIVIAGMAGNVARWAQFAPGSTTPVATGQAAFPGNATQGLAIGFAGADKLVLAGQHSFQGDRNMAVARFDAIPNTTVAVEDLPSSGPSALRLYAPFPNPVVNRSMFAFELPRAGSVRLAIHDVSGRQVRLLMDEALTAGRHQRLWDGTDDQGRGVAAGMYFARLVAGPDHAAASLVVLR
jgi:uncharacterized delta-60 repeat protein